MGHVIPLHGDPHEVTQRLLPWYVTGTLEPVEQALVEQHLADCPDCHAELESERRLRAAVSALPPVPAGQWEALRDRALATPQERTSMFAGRAPRWLALAAAQAAILVLGIGAYEWARPGEDAAYHALSSGTDRPKGGNLIVIFRPDVSEQALRGTLKAVGARLVDGPTEAGAYVLAVPQAARETALQGLRGRAEIVLAQPIDGDGAR